MSTDTVRLDHWEHQCLNRLLVGHPAECAAEVSGLPPELQRALEVGLAACRTREQVQTVFAAARYIAPYLERGEWEESKHPRDKDGRWASGSGNAAPQQRKHTATRTEPLSSKAALQRVLEVHEGSQAKIVELERERAGLDYRLKDLQDRHERAQQVFAKAPTASAKSQAEAQVQYVEGQLDRALDQDKHAKDSIKVLREAASETIRDTVCGFRRLPLKAVVLDSFTHEDQGTLRQGCNAATLLMGDLPYSPQTLKIAQSRTDSSYFDDDTKAVYFWPGDAPKYVVHEIGHWLEDYDPTILQKAAAFYEARTHSESEVLLKDVTGINEYENQTTKVDKFLDPYMGKIYRDGDGKIKQTEIISMGLQYFFDNPGTLAKHDPEYFALIYGIIHPGS